MKASEIIKVLDNFAPPYLVDSWDSAGFQIGDSNKEIKKILLSLDLDNNILEYAIKNNVDMIINHHPILFMPIGNLTNLNNKGNMISTIIKEDIVIYNAHTNLDKTIGGVNDVLAELFELKDTEILAEIMENDNILYGHGRVGNINKIKIIDFIYNVKKILEVDTVTVYGDIEKEIERVAVCGGSGADFIKEASSKNADLYITGDIKYHEAQEAIERGLVIVDAGHYHTEKVILPKLKELLINNFKESLEIELYFKSSPVYKVY